LTQRIGAFLTHLVANANQWSEREVARTHINVPAPETFVEPETTTTTSTSTSTSTSSSSSSSRRAPKPSLEELKKKRLEEEAIEKANHKGYPALTKRGNLDPYVCNYPKCGKVFRVRDELFRHLNRMIEPERMIRNYHQNHFKLKVSDPKALKCGACGAAFPTVGKVQAHYRDNGVPGDWKDADPITETDTTTTTTSSSSSSNNNNKTTTAPTTTTTTTAASAPSPPPATEAPKPPEEKPPVDPYANIGVCVICMERNREVVNVPCGHVVCCATCVMKTCPICRADVKESVRVYYS